MFLTIPTSDFTATSATSPLMEREAQFLVLAQDQHHWQTLRDAMGLEIIDELLREEEDSLFREIQQDELAFEHALLQHAKRIINTCDRTRFNLRHLRNGVRTGRFNSLLAVMVAYQMGCIDVNYEIKKANTTFPENHKKVIVAVKTHYKKAVVTTAFYVHKHTLLAETYLDVAYTGDSYSYLCEIGEDGVEYLKCGWYESPLESDYFTLIDSGEVLCWMEVPKALIA